MFSPATVMLVKWGSRPFKVKRCFRSSVSKFCEFIVVIPHYKYGALSKSSIQLNFLFRHVLLPKSSLPLPALSRGVVLTIGCTKHSSNVFASWMATVLHQGQITCTITAALYLRKRFRLLWQAQLMSPSDIHVLHWSMWSLNTISMFKLNYTG